MRSTSSTPRPTRPRFGTGCTTGTTPIWKPLNRSWGTVVGTRPTPNGTSRLPDRHPRRHEPPTTVGRERFISDTGHLVIRIQTEILRALAPRQWITTNGMYKHLDNHRLTDELLDFFSFDSYPNFSTIRTPIVDVNHTDSTTTGGGRSVDPLGDRAWSWLLSIVRGISPTFAVLEQQSGAGGWVDRIAQPAPKPGQCAYGRTNRSRMAATWCCTSDGERRPSGPRSTGTASTTSTINQIDG